IEIRYFTKVHRGGPVLRVTFSKSHVSGPNPEGGRRANLQIGRDKQWVSAAAREHETLADCPRRQPHTEAGGVTAGQKGRAGRSPRAQADPQILRANCNY